MWANAPRMPWKLVRSLIRSKGLTPMKRSFSGSSCCNMKLAITFRSGRTPLSTCSIASPSIAPYGWFATRATPPSRGIWATSSGATSTCSSSSLKRAWMNALSERSPMTSYICWSLFNPLTSLNRIKRGSPGRMWLALANSTGSRRRFFMGVPQMYLGSKYPTPCPAPALGGGRMID